MRDAHYNVISVLGVRDAKGCEMRIFLGGCESLCPQSLHTGFLAYARATLALAMKSLPTACGLNEFDWS